MELLVVLIDVSDNNNIAFFPKQVGVGFLIDVSIPQNVEQRNLAYD